MLGGQARLCVLGLDPAQQVVLHLGIGERAHPVLRQDHTEPRREKRLQLGVVIVFREEDEVGHRLQLLRDQAGFDLAPQPAEQLQRAGRRSEGVARRQIGTLDRLCSSPASEEGVEEKERNAPAEAAQPRAGGS